MLHDLGELDDALAAGAICPMPDCGALTLAYRSAGDIGGDDAELAGVRLPTLRVRIRR